MILITSGAYIDSSLASEFGNIPPCMLPVKNKRLYEHQIELIRNQFGYDEKIIISLPKSYFIEEYDYYRINELGAKYVQVKDNLTLGQSIASILCDIEDDVLYILHGDTLFSNLSKELDVCSVGKPYAFYNWTYSNKINEFDYKRIHTGFFSFSSSNALLKKLLKNNYTLNCLISGLKEIELEGWLDFSLTSTYYKSISKFTTQRVFNNLSITEYSVTKSSKDNIKMQAESNWLSSIPVKLKKYVPHIYEKKNDSYTIEYLYNSSLANIFVFGNLDVCSLKDILDKCVEYINIEKQYKPDARINTNYLYTEKTLSRLSYLDLDKKYTINGVQIGSIREIIEDLDTYIDKDCYKYNSIMHGDLCFSNILYDSRSNHIKLIDPRGVDNKHNISIYGDWRYDVAKLAHSVVGKYDFIIANRFKYKENSPTNIEFYIEYDNKVEELDKYFDKFFDFRMYYPIMINLFLSMIPLHSDNNLRQKAMLANALDLYDEFKYKLENDKLS